MNSTHAVEWEILKDVMVVEERENILPGFAQTLTATLDAGDYAMTCGLRSNPKGILTVAATSAAPPKPSPMDLVGPIAEYKVYVKAEVDVLVAETRKAHRRRQGRQAGRGAEGLRARPSAL